MFWDSFVTLCNQKNTTPTAVVKLLGIAGGSVTKWKNGSVPSQKNVVRIAEYFKVDIGELMGYSAALPEYSPEKKELLNRLEGLSKDEVKQINEYIDFIISRRGK